MTYCDEHEDDQTGMSEVIDQLYHWPICPNCAAGLTEVDQIELEACSQCGFRLGPIAAKESETMISNPATFFTSGSDCKSFTYEGGAKLFHWSPYTSGLSTSMESNVMFFANDIDHARDVLRRLLEFWIACNDLYVASQRVVEKKRRIAVNDYHGFIATKTAETNVLKRYLTVLDKMKFTEVPTNQFFKVSWASNDDLNVYEK